MIQAAADNPIASDNLSHAGRTVLVTGGGRGLGAAAAQRFAQRGARVAIVDIDGDAATAVANGIRAVNGRAEAACLDVADFEACRDVYAALAERLGHHFDVLLNNAGISPKHDGRAHAVWEMQPAEWSAVMGVNLTAAFNAVRLLTPGMRDGGQGAIINMSSVAGRTFTPIVGVHYATSKAALIGFTKHLAGELGPDNITVNAIAPGRIATPMIHTMAPSVNDEVIRTTPLRRLGRPEEVADLALFFASEEARFITGQVCDVAGGWLMT